jgi:hypothetical protein
MRKVIIKYKGIFKSLILYEEGLKNKPKHVASIKVHCEVLHGGILSIHVTVNISGLVNHDDGGSGS